MRCLIALIGLLGVVACSPQGSKQDPRDRKSLAEGAVTWRVVAQKDGHAAFLSRPGTAPDLVLWCRDSQEVTLRAHIFQTPSTNPDLRLDTKGGSMPFANVRRQGGVRDGDRILVEGTSLLQDAKIGPVLEAAGELSLTSGSETYRAGASDPKGVMKGFLASCQSLGNKCQSKAAGGSGCQAAPNGN